MMSSQLYINYRVPYVLLGMLLIFAVANTGVHAQTESDSVLTLAEAIKIAHARDAKLQMYKARSASLREKAVADNTLPDPKLKLGLMNFPSDTFERDQEAMTQVQVGVQQMFPAGQTLSIKSQQTQIMSRAEAARADDQQRQLLMNVRQVWLELYYWTRAEQIVNKDTRLFSRLIKITQSQYSSGRQRQQDVLRAELEMGRLEDRLRRILVMKDKRRASLLKYIGVENTRRSLHPQFPQLPIMPSRSDWLVRHPLMQLENANVSKSEKGVALARQSYKPSWMVDVTYGFRDGFNPNGTERTDFVSAMVSFDLPLFTGDRQDRKVAASKYQLNGAQNTRDERERMLREMWHASFTMWQHHADRKNHFQNTLLPVAKENTRAALSSYQSGRGDFNSLMRAQIMELETQLNALRVKVDYARAHAQLLYLTGEEQ